MKKTAIWIVTLTLLLGTLCGCGENASGAAKTVDLQEFLEETEQRYELGSITPLEDELLDAFYPGLREIKTEQLVAYMPMITGRVSEYVFLQCTDSADTRAAADILQQRIDEQAAGGAWYPESTAAWKTAQVVIRGNYVLMIAAGDLTEQIAADFDAKLNG